jgi:hypothetical protein
VNGKGTALLTYRAHGKLRHVLAWGAVNARMPTSKTKPKQPQVKFTVDYSGGWGTQHKLVWKTFENACGRYDGPKLDSLVAACKAPDGSYWALQYWQKDLPDLGFLPWTANQRAWNLELSHWKGPLPKLQLYPNWIGSGKDYNVFGRETYRGIGVHGYGTTSHGENTDSYGRLLYLDTLGSAYGKGWRRENAFVPHAPAGNYCYGFFTHDPTKGGYSAPPGWKKGTLTPKGNGARYRMIARGPGVTPNVVRLVKGLAPYDPGNTQMVIYKTNLTALQLVLAAGDASCGGS